MIKKHCEISRLPERVSIADADWALVSSSGHTLVSHSTAFN